MFCLKKNNNNKIIIINSKRKQGNMTGPKGTCIFTSECEKKDTRFLFK